MANEVDLLHGASDWLPTDPIERRNALAELERRVKILREEADQKINDDRLKAAINKCWRHQRNDAKTSESGSMS